jgi:hypothetical protein
MGMATPANNHKNVNANDYGPRAILATTRLNLGLPFFIFLMFLWGLAYFGTKPSLFASVEICWFILSVFKICCKIFLFQTGKRV